MSNASNSTTVTAPSYPVSGDKKVGYYYVSLAPNGPQLPIEREEIRDCAGDPLDDP